MRIVALYAYLCDNVGDDLMVDILLRRYPDTVFFYNNYCGGEKFCSYSNFYNLNRFYKKWGKLNYLVNILTLNIKKDILYRVLLKIIRFRTKCSVYIGGSIYMQHSGITAESERNKLANGPLFVVGANFGPYQDVTFYESFYEYFKCCQDVCFRDQASFRLFSKLSNVRYAPDVVFNIQKLNYQGGSTVLISVIDFSFRKQIQTFEEAYLKLIAEICKQVIEQGKTPVLCSFCEKEGDYRAIEKVFPYLESSLQDKIKIYRYNSISSLMELLKQTCFIVATRFHAMILAIKYHIPFYCISYDNKIKNVMDDIGCNAYCLPSEIDSIKTEKIFDFQFQFTKTSDYINKAEEQFKALDSFLLRRERN